MNDGRAFEEEISQLLKIQGWQVQPEQLLDYKRIDLFAAKASHFGKQERIAIECKDYIAPLTQAQVTAILANYAPLVQKYYLDYVLLVTRNGLTPSAAAYCSAAREIHHVTHLSLLNSLLDLQQYVAGLISHYRHDSLDAYYVSQAFRARESPDVVQPEIEEALLAWIDGDDPAPRVILASYGMGKTTLTKRLAFLLAERYLKDSHHRIPILIRLEDLVSEQSLDGLIARQFTVSAIVSNYNFDTFMALNARGRFVVILDGLDEMKMAMSPEAMRYNLGQLHRLVGSESRVLLTGRPSIFMDADEYREALHGTRVIQGKAREIPGWPSYRELFLEPFSAIQVQEFIPAYAEVLITRDPRLRESLNISDLVARLGSNQAGHLVELASRPVQLKMMLEVLPWWRGQLDTLTLAVLYAEFIDLIIRRELEKPARQRFALAQRRSFAIELAWWMWTEGRGSSVTGAKLPDSLFEPFLPEDASLADVRRDLLAACFLEVKHPDGYYFPHRSFLEFMVAERVATAIKAGRVAGDAATELTPEIEGFVIGILGQRDVAHWNDTFLAYRGTVQDWMLDLFAAQFDVPPSQAWGTPSPWIPVIVARGLCGRWKDLPPLEKKTLIEAAVLGRPPGGGDDRWSRLIVALAYLLHDEMRAAGVEKTEELRGFMQDGGTLERYVNLKKAPVNQFLADHTDREFCFVQGWSRVGVGETVDVSQLIGRRSAGVWVPVKKRRTGQAKTPHKVRGVTKKKKWSSPGSVDG